MTEHLCCFKFKQFPIEVKRQDNTKKPLKHLSDRLQQQIIASDQEFSYPKIHFKRSYLWTCS